MPIKLFYREVLYLFILTGRFQQYVSRTKKPETNDENIISYIPEQIQRPMTLDIRSK